MIEYTLFCVVLLSCVYQTTWLRGSDSIHQTLSCLEKNKNKDQFGSWLILLRWFKWSDSLKRARISITSLWVQQIKGKKILICSNCESTDLMNQCEKNRFVCESIITSSAVSALHLGWDLCWIKRLKISISVIYAVIFVCYVESVISV